MVVRVLVAVVLALVGVAAAWLVGMRTGFRPVVDLQRRVNRAVVNPRQMRTAGGPGAYAGVVHHVGRASGRPYDTPVVPFPSDDGFVVVLPYGTRPDWVRNVLAAGSATIRHEGRTYEVAEPEVVPIQDAPVEFPASEQRGHRLVGVDRCMVLRTVGPVSPG